MTRNVLAWTFRSAMIALLVLGWLLPAQPHVSAAGETENLVARVQTPDFELTTNGVEVPGYVLHTVPGAPSLPLHGISFDLPLDGAWELSFESTGSRILDERIDLAAAPTPDLDLNGPVAPQDRAELPSAVPLVNRPDPSIYTVDAFYPASPVVAGDVVRQGDRRILPVRVFPFQYNPVTRQLRYHPELVVHVQVQAGGEATPLVTPSSVGFYEPTTLPGDGVLRIHTGERGLYRLTYDDLQGAGVPVGAGGAHPNTFAVFYQGQQVHIQVTGAADGRFDPGDLVIFYAVPYDGGRYQNYNVYQFVYGGNVVGQRMATRPVTAASVPGAASIITRTLHVEFDRDYRSLYQRPDHADHFFDTVLYPNSTNPSVTTTYDLALANQITSGGTVKVQALIHGGINQAANPDQSVQLSLNSNVIGTYPWEDRVDHLITANVPATWLSPASNQVHLTAALAQLPNLTGPNPYYWISPDWVRVSYPSVAVSNNNRLYIEGLISPTNLMAVSGFTSTAVSIYDVRNPSQPLRLSGAGAKADNGAFTIHWDETVANATYMLSTEASLLAPGAIERDSTVNWASANHAYDYVAIIGAERSYNGTTGLGAQLETALQPLLAHRAAEGFSVATVRVQDIYNQWSYGRIDPLAIRSFLHYAYFNWATPPAYVLLVGDGHYDYNRVTTQPLPNLIPPYLAYVDPWLGEVPTDNLYVSVDGLADYLPDMAVGRLPVNSAADVTAMVDKILAYENVALNPPGLWQQRAVYVADDCTDPAGNFHVLSNQGRLQWLPSVYSNLPIYYDNPNIPTVCPDGTHTDRFEMRAAVRQAFSNGALYLQWFGHGSQARWGGAHSQFQASDVPNMAPAANLPFTTANACLTGYFVWQSPYTPYPYTQSLAEVMVITPQRGSIADLSPSGLHVGSALLTLQRGMHKALFEDRIQRAGDASDAAKFFFFQNSFGWHDVIDTMIFFGDPALKLRHPTGDLSDSTLQVSGAAAPLGATLTYTLTISNSSIFTTTQPLAVVDYPQGLAAVANAGGGANNGDTLTWTLPNLPPGGQHVLTFELTATGAAGPENFQLVVPATVSSQMAPQVALQVQTAIATGPNAVASALATNRDFLPPGFPVTTTLTLSHESSLPASGVQVTMTLPAELGAPTWLSASSGSLVYDPVNHRVTWGGNVPAGDSTQLAFRSQIEPNLTACADLLLDAAVAYRDAITPHLTVVGLVVPDVNCSGSVTVADIQLVAARWGSQTGDPAYHPLFDLNADDVIDVLDITATAQAWQ